MWYVSFKESFFIEEMNQRSSPKKVNFDSHSYFDYQIPKPLEKPEIYRHNRLYVCRIRIKLLTIYKSEILLFYCLVIER